MKRNFFLVSKPLHVTDWNGVPFPATESDPGTEPSSTIWQQQGVPSTKELCILEQWWRGVSTSV